MDFLQWFSDFYQKNQTLVVALVSLVGGAILTRFLPALYSTTIKLLAGLRRKLGGQVARNIILGQYLDWVILQNQDLKLTGIIGLGQKPKLEQIFISLKISRVDSTGGDKAEDETQSKGYTRNLDIRRAGNWIRDNVHQLSTRIFSFLRSSREVSRLTLFQERRFWRIRLILERDHLAIFLLLLIFTFFLWFCFRVLSVSKPDSIAVVASTAMLIWLVFVMYDLQKDVIILANRGITLVYIWLPISALGYVVVKRVIIDTEPWLALAVGVVIGLAASAYRHQKEKSRQQPSREQTARETGLLLTSNDYIAILGQPGSGKSTYVQFIALTFAQAKASERKFRRADIIRKRFGISQWYFPILLPLRKVSNIIRSESNNWSLD